MARAPAVILLVLLGLGVTGCATLPHPQTLDPAGQTELGRIRTYLNGLQCFSARFGQTGFLGGGSGMVWVRRPGALRLRYDAGQTRDIVADQGVLVVRDLSSGGMTTTRLARTPLGLLLAGRIGFGGAVGIDGLTHDAGTEALTVQDRAHPEQGTLTLRFTYPDLGLIGLTATDIHGRALHLTLTDLRDGCAAPPGIFALPAG